MRHIRRTTRSFAQVTIGYLSISFVKNAILSSEAPAKNGCLYRDLLLLILVIIPRGIRRNTHRPAPYRVEHLRAPLYRRSGSAPGLALPSAVRFPPTPLLPRPRRG